MKNISPRDANNVPAIWFMQDWKFTPVSADNPLPVSGWWWGWINIDTLTLKNDILAEVRRENTNFVDKNYFNAEIQKTQDWVWKIVFDSGILSISPDNLNYEFELPFTQDEKKLTQLMVIKENGTYNQIIIPYVYFSAQTPTNNERFNLFGNILRCRLVANFNYRILIFKYELS